MNEIIFFLFLILIVSMLVISARLGKESLVASMSMCALLSNIFVLKQIKLFGYTATASDALALGATLALNILQEHYDKQTAQRAIVISFFCLVVYTCATMLHCAYVPTGSDWSNIHYQALFSFMPRLTCASLIVYYIAQQIDYYIYQHLKVHYLFEHQTRSFISTSISQAADTILFTIGGLYGIVDNLGSILVISYIFKVITLVFCIVMLPFITRSAQKLYAIF